MDEQSKPLSSFCQSCGCYLQPHEGNYVHRDHIGLVVVCDTCYRQERTILDEEGRVCRSKSSGT